MHNLRDLDPADLRLKDKQGEKQGRTTMNIFTKHTQQQGVTYLEHLFFAVSIAISKVQCYACREFQAQSKTEFVNIGH